MVKAKQNRKEREPIGYAFWRYASYPGVLGAPFTEIDDVGFVYVPTYDRRFRPILVISVAAGRALQKTLDSLVANYENEKKKLEMRFRELLVEKAPEIAAKLPLRST